jgi:GNAT superfamily N-acetyltransferase
MSDRSQIRPARPEEAAALTELAVRSTGHWGYDSVFLAVCRAHLEVTPDAISAGRVQVLEGAGGVIGFHGLAGEPPEVRLGWLFVEPDEIGRGHGRRLWDDALGRARSAGSVRMRVSSDRFAEPFFHAMGATRVDEEASPVDGAPLAVLVVDL